MAFDIATAKPVKSGFDINTAKPIITKPESSTGYTRGERSVIGNIFERPGAAVRSLIQGKGYKAGAEVPEEVPRFQDLALNKYYNMVGKQAENMTPIQRNIHFGLMSIPGLGVSAGGTAADIVTNPADLLMMLAGRTPVNKTAAGEIRNLGNVVSESKPGLAFGKFMTKERNLPKFQEAGIFKQGRDFVYEKLAKPAAEEINTYIKTNPTEIQKKLNLKDETVKLIKKYGYDKVSDSDLVFEEAENAFKTAMSNKTSVYGDRVNIKDSLKEMEKQYNLTKATNPNSPLKGIIDRVKQFQPARKGFYKDKVPTNTQLGRMLNGEKLTDIAGEVRVTREQFTDIRQQISNLYKKEGFDKVKAFKIIDSLYNDAEQSGLKGIKEARNLYKQAHEFEGIVTDLRKLEKVDSAKIFNDVQKVVKDPSEYKIMIDKYTPYMGKDKAIRLFNQAISVRHGKQVIGGATAVAGITAAGAVGNKIINTLRRPSVGL